MDKQVPPFLPQNTRCLQIHLKEVGIPTNVADDVLLKRVKVTQLHWKAGAFFMDDDYLRDFVLKWLRGWSHGTGVKLEWLSSFIVHIRAVKKDYHKVVHKFLLKGFIPPPDIVHKDVLDAKEIAIFVRNYPGVLWTSRTANWVQPFLFQLENPWDTIVLGSPRFLRKCLRVSREGAILACVCYAPRYLHIVLKHAPTSELYVCDKEGNNLLELAADEPYIFCQLARAGAPKEGIREHLLILVRSGEITSAEFRMMRSALGDYVYTRCCC